MITESLCTNCKVVLPIDRFSKNKTKRNGISNECKSCAYKRDKANFNKPGAKEKYNQYKREWRKGYRAQEAEQTKKWRSENPERAQAAVLKWRKENRHKYLAQRAVTGAIYEGRMMRQPCERCGNPKSHAHHEDYTKRLDVIWLCALHHKERHAEIRKLQKENQ